jgi:hypothetical protein
MANVSNLTYAPSVRCYDPPLTEWRIVEDGRGQFSGLGGSQDVDAVFTGHCLGLGLISNMEKHADQP